MSPEAQRIAIAEACPNLFERCYGGWLWATRFPHRIGPVDPLSDLNAMHEAEKTQCAKDAGFGHLMADALIAICHTESARFTPYWRATAAQRAEAFLRTLGKWEDSA